MIKGTVRLNLEPGNRYEKGIVDGSELTILDITDAIIEDIKAHWSPVAPSTPGNPPAKVSGNLERSLQADKTGRTASGRFAAPGDAVSVIIRANADYAGILEDAMKRPFFAPAFERAALVFDVAFKRLFT